MTWFPNNNTPRDKATFTTRLTVPYTALGCRAAHQPDRGQQRRARLDHDRPAAPAPSPGPAQRSRRPTSRWSAIGRYTRHRSDVALTTGTTPEWSYADSTRRADVGSRRRARQALADPEGRSRATTAPTRASAPASSSTSSSLGYALETQDRPYFENTIGQYTLIHELAHQWFGDAVSPTDWSDVWLNEGPATFIATQVEARALRRRLHRGHLLRRLEPRPPPTTLLDDPGRRLRRPRRPLRRQTYDRGAMALEALRSALGDATFDADHGHLDRDATPAATPRPPTSSPWPSRSRAAT